MEYQAPQPTMLIFRRNMRIVLKNLVMILMISGVEVTRQISFSVKGKCAVKELEYFQDDGLQIHGHTYEDKYKFHNSYFIFGGPQVS